MNTYYGEINKLSEEIAKQKKAVEELEMARIHFQIKHFIEIYENEIVDIQESMIFTMKKHISEVKDYYYILGYSFDGVGAKPVDDFILIVDFLQGDNYLMSFEKFWECELKGEGLNLSKETLEKVLEEWGGCDL